MMRARRLGARAGAAWAALLAAPLGCFGATPSVATPTEARPGAELRPPRLSRPLDWSMPRLAQARLANGLAVQLMERRSLPLIELRLVIASGGASDFEHPGAAALTLAALGLVTPSHPGAGALSERIEALGGRLQVHLTRDATLLSASLPRSALAAALPLLEAITLPPRWTPAEFELLRRRELQRVSTLQRTSPSWAASVALYAELFRATPRHHPYARFDVLPGDLERLTLEDCRAWYAANVSPKNTFLLVAGDTTLAQLLPLAQHTFGNWQGREVAPPVFFTPPRPTRLKALLVDQPHARSSELRVALLLPERRSTDWTPLAIANQILGGMSPSRLLRDLAQSTGTDPMARSWLEEVAYDATPLVISARVSTEQTASALAAVLESLHELVEREPAPRELLQATEQLAAGALWQLGTLSGAADLLSQVGILGLPENSLEEFRRNVGRIPASEVRGAALRHLKTPPVVVVVGDAGRLLTPISHFGQVHILNPGRDFQVERVVSQDPTAPLELLPNEP